MPELVSIQLGEDAFRFKKDMPTELVMRSGCQRFPERVDLPKLTTLCSMRVNVISFLFPNRVVLESGPSPSFSLLDMPSLTMVNLRSNAFSYAKSQTVSSLWIGVD